jgi:hypothetical protein
MLCRRKGDDYNIKPLSVKSELLANFFDFSTQNFPGQDKFRDESRVRAGIKVAALFCARLGPA